MKDIDDLRQRIDWIDEQIVRLLNARAQCALEVGRCKKVEGLEIYQPLREQEVLEHVQRLNTGPLDDAAIKAVRRWEFNPARFGVTPVAAAVEVPVRFGLN